MSGTVGPIWWLALLGLVGMLFSALSWSLRVGFIAISVSLGLYRILILIFYRRRGEWQECRDFILKQYRLHREEARKTWLIVRLKAPEQLRHGIIERIVLSILIIHPFVTLVNVLVFILRLFASYLYKCPRLRWLKEDNHFYVEMSVILVLVGLINLLLHLPPHLLLEDRVPSIVITFLFLLVGWVLVEVISVLFRIVFLNQYRPWVGGAPVSVNRSILLLIANFAEIILCFSLFYLWSQSIGCCDGVPIVRPLQSVYFSIVTITTLGYGDFHPVDSLGQWLVIIEVSVGFVFVVLIFSHFVQFLQRDPSGR